MMGWGMRRMRGEDAGEGPFGPRHGRRRLFDGEELRLLLLSLISDEKRHGYELIKAIEELSGGVYAPSPGMVYPLLAMMAEMGAIAEAADASARRSFAITETGRAELERAGPTVKALRERLQGLAAQREKTDSMPVRRAMHNLRVVLETRLGQEGVSRDTLLETAALIDEAARKIERL
jgi:DNA-binding PadR family transcriptional regulator